jgi:alpha-beta hydrolase superfamily lysophospholipase
VEKFEISRIKTKDDFFLDGIIFEPEKKGELAVIYVHGLGGAFYGNPTRLQEYAKKCKENGFAFFSFNNRGNNAIIRLDKEGKEKLESVDCGSAFEKFSDCVFDLDSYIEEARKRGYEKIVLIGHSSGANKVVHYLHKKPKNKVILAVLSGAVSDVPMIKKMLGKGYEKAIEYAKKAKSKDELLPYELVFQYCSAQRFLNLATERSEEDVFQYHLKNSQWKEIKSIKIPTLAIIGENDQYATIEVKEILDNYRKANALIEVEIVQGADHSFRGKERESVGKIVEWVKNKLK